MDINVNKYNELIKYNNDAFNQVKTFSNPWKTLSKISPYICVGSLIILFWTCCTFNSTAMLISFICCIISIVLLITSKILNRVNTEKYNQLKTNQINAYNNIKTYVYNYITNKYDISANTINTSLVEFYNLNKDNAFATSWWLTLNNIKLVDDFLYLNKELNKYIIDNTQHSIDYWDNKFSETNYSVSVKSSKAVESYDDIKFFKENSNTLEIAKRIIDLKSFYKKCTLDFITKSNTLYKNEHLNYYQNTIKKKISSMIPYYIVYISYVSPAGKSTNHRTLYIDEYRLNILEQDKSLLMNKSEYNAYLKSQEQEKLNEKHKLFYDKVNIIIDKANVWKDSFIIKEDRDSLDNLISNLFDKTVNSIQKIKSIQSEEWNLIDKYISDTNSQIDSLINRNKQIQDYYVSNDFYQIKSTVDTLMSTQKEFNEYIDEKAKAITSLFGTKVMRNKTEIEDEYNYIHTYKKSITPFTAEVSQSVFASAENDPLTYIIKHFYPDKEKYPEQILKLQTLIEELETLKEAKQIIENYKKEYQQYLTNVPDYIMKYDEDSFYSRLGFANISENILTVEYKFSYTSFGGKSQRSFTVPMTEETIISLINALQNKLTYSTFAKEQRSLMTSKLRQQIKERDNYTCVHCGNSIYKEPNLLLEVDHIVSIAQGGYTVEDNLQTLCWVCNRHKSSKSNESIIKENQNRTTKIKF